MTKNMQILPNFKFLCQHVTIMLLLIDLGWRDGVKKGLQPKKGKWISVYAKVKVFFPRNIPARTLFVDVFCLRTILIRVGQKTSIQFCPRTNLV